MSNFIQNSWDVCSNDVSGKIVPVAQTAASENRTANSSGMSVKIEPPQSELSRMDEMSAAERSRYMRRVIWALRYR